MAQAEMKYRQTSRKRRRKRRRMRLLRSFVLFVFVVSAVVIGIALGNAVRERAVIKENGIPMLLQTDEKWGNIPYGSSTISVSGCGPTCLSMVAMGLTGNGELTPDAVARFSEEHGYYVSGVGTSWLLMTDGARQLGLKAKELALDEGIIKAKLTRGYPIICSVGPGDFTDEGHFIVLTGYEDGMIHINDPNSVENSSKLWSYERLKTQISAMWFYK